MFIGIRSMFDLKAVVSVHVPVFAQMTACIILSKPSWWLFNNLLLTNNLMTCGIRALYSDQIHLMGPIYRFIPQNEELLMQNWIIGVVIIIFRELKYILIKIARYKMQVERLKLKYFTNFDFFFIFKALSIKEFMLMPLRNHFQLNRIESQRTEMNSRLHSNT